MATAITYTINVQEDSRMAQAKEVHSVTLDQIRARVESGNKFDIVGFIADRMSMAQIAQITKISLRKITTEKQKVRDALRKFNGYNAVETSDLATMLPEMKAQEATGPLTADSAANEVTEATQMNGTNK